jgi:hypothetical protein
MKTISKNFLATFVFFLFVTHGTLAHANPVGKELAFNFSIFNLFESSTATDTATDTLLDSQTTEQVSTDTVATDTLNSCEHFDSATGNILTLETASADARQKIENVEETINKEESLRDNIFYSVKNFLGLQKQDKVIFREMKKDITGAKGYYDDLDQKIYNTTDYLSENSCEDVKVKDARKVDNDTTDLVQDEVTYRKQFAGSLKEKIRILQNGVKEAKK